MTTLLPDFLPGTLLLERGSSRDYASLEQFHYLPKRPATWADVWRIRYSEAGDDRVIAVAVLSFPHVSCRLRDRALGLQGKSARQRLRFVNANIRAISRVIVHPQFRSLGLSTILVKCLLDQCPTRYVESVAMMARAHPFFERAGMTRFDPDDPEQAVYFVYDRSKRIDSPARTST